MFAKSRKYISNVIPAHNPDENRGVIQKCPMVTKELAPGFRRGDHFCEFLISCLIIKKH